MSGMRKDVPAYAASCPRTRSSSVGWPHDSWTWSAAWVASRMTVMVPAGHSAAVSSAAASSAIRPALPGRSNASMASQPAHTWCRPKLFGKLRVCTSSSLVAVASRPPPDSMMVWSSTAPSLLAKCRTSRTNSSEHSLTRIWGRCDMASSVRSRRSTLSSREISKGSRSTGVRYSPTSAGAGPSRTGVRLTRDEAFAIRTAWRAVSSALPALRSSMLANPQAPPAITRMPMPSSSDSSTDATAPFLTVSRCTVRLMTLQSAYVAPAAAAASRARALRSRTRAEYTDRGGGERFGLAGAIPRCAIPRRGVEVWNEIVLHDSVQVHRVCVDDHLLVERDRRQQRGKALVDQAIVLRARAEVGGIPGEIQVLVDLGIVEPAEVHARAEVGARRDSILLQ